MLECRFRQLVRACVSHAHNNERASDPLTARFTRPIGCSQANHRVRTWPLLAAMSASGSAPAPCHSFNVEERCVAAGYDNGDIKLLDLRTNAVIRRAGPAQSHALLRRAASVERASSHVCLSAHCPRGSTDRDAHTLHCGPAPAQLKWSAARFLTHPCCETLPL